MRRLVQPELLDALPTDDPGAVRSREDLQRLNRWMRHAPLMAAALSANLKSPPAVLVELGAGDGTLMLELAGQLNSSWPGVRVVLVDAKGATSDATLAALNRLGWQAETVVADVFDWIAAPGIAADAILANLFLHHFNDHRLGILLRGISRNTPLMVACETRRQWPSFAAARCLRLLGCHTITRHDAIASMKAGFVNGELAKLWPGHGWQVTEQRIRLFTHWFVARKLD
jgi:hypothetical protein